MTSPYVLLRFMTSYLDIYASNLIYQPSNIVEHLVKGCRKVDVKSCPDDTDKDTQTLCQRYHLPVISKSRNKLESMVYNNIGCYLCNNRRTFKPNCESSYNRKQSYSLQLNFLTSSQNTMVRYNSSEHQILNISFTERGGTTKCKAGFVHIYDTVIVILNFFYYDHHCHVLLYNKKVDFLEQYIK